MSDDQVTKMSLKRPRISPKVRPHQVELVDEALEFWQGFRSRELLNVEINVTHCVFRLTGSIKEQGFEFGLKELARRHDLLRARVDESSGKPFYVFDDNFVTPLDVIDLVGQDIVFPSSEYIEEKARNIVRDFIWKDFEFDDAKHISGNLSRACLIKLSESEGIFILVLHHVIADALSMINAKEEIVGSYNRYLTGDFTKPPTLGVQYHDHLSSKSEWMRTADGSFAQEYWKRNAEIEKPFLLVPDFNVSEWPSSDKSHCIFMLKGKSLESINKFSENHKISAAIIFLVAKASVMMRRSDNADVLIKVLRDSRDQSMLFDQIGNYVSVLPFRFHINGGLSVADTLSKIRESWLKLITCTPVYLAELRNTYRLSMCPSLNFISSHGHFNPSQSSENIQLSAYNVPEPDFSDKKKYSKPSAHLWRQSTGLTIIKTFDNLFGCVRYSTDMYRKETIQQFIDELTLFIEISIEYPNWLIDDVLNKACAMSS